MTVELISLISALAVFIFMILGFSLAFKIRDKKVGKAASVGWLNGLYKTFFGNKPEVEIAKKIGINGEEYLKNCEIIHKKNDLKGVIMMKLIGLLLIIVGIFIGVLIKNYYILGAFLAIGFIVFEYPTYTVKKKVKEKKMAIEKELPRFVDMLQVALKINIPIEQAINITSDYLPGTVLAEEFKYASTETSLGVTSWQDSLERVAKTYQIDDLTDFVLSLIIAYDKGVSIVDTVEQKAEALRKSNLFAAKEKANKMNSEILIPVAIFKLLPLIAIMAIPIVAQLKNGI